MMLIDYSLHNTAYQSKRKSGWQGWDEDEVIAENLEQLNGIFEHEVIPKQGKILDVGCGAGNVAFWLESRGFEVFGIDVSAEAIAWAQEKAARLDAKVQFEVADATQKQFKLDYKSDIILDNHCLHCIIGQDRAQYLLNIYNSLNLGGVYILLTMCSDGMAINSLPNYDVLSKCTIYNNVATRYIGLKTDILNELTECGFTVQYLDFTPGTDSSGELIIIVTK